jgi:hypothetical protein
VGQGAHSTPLASLLTRLTRHARALTPTPHRPSRVQILGATINLSQQATNWMDDPVLAARTVRFCIAYAYASKQFLREGSSASKYARAVRSPTRDNPRQRPTSPRSQPRHPAPRPSRACTASAPPRPSHPASTCTPALRAATPISHRTFHDRLPVLRSCVTTLCSPTRTSSTSPARYLA